MVGRNDLRGMTDAWQAYIDLALGFTETSRKRATKVVKQMVGKSNATADQLQTMAEDLVNTGLANREAMVRLIRFELDKALGRVGLATAEEVGELTTRLRDLEEKLRAAQSAPEGVPAAAEAAAATPAPARKAPAKRAPAKTTTAKAAPAKTTGAAKATTPARTAGARTTSKAAPATKATTASSASAPAGTAAKKTVAKKTVAKKAVAAKTTGAGA